MTRRNELSSAWDRGSHTSNDLVADGIGATMAANRGTMPEASAGEWALAACSTGTSVAIVEWLSACVEAYGMAARRRVGLGS